VGGEKLSHETTLVQKKRKVGLAKLGKVDQAGGAAEDVSGVHSEKEGKKVCHLV